MSESDVVEASHQAMKQPSSKKQIQGMMAIQDPAKKSKCKYRYRCNISYSWIVQ